MLFNRFPKLRFSLKSIFVLMLGIAIGFSLNLWAFRFLTGPANEARMSSLPPYVIEPPDILELNVLGNASDATSSISGQHLVGMDGKVNLGAYGQVYVAGKTIEEARDAIEMAVSQHGESLQVVVDIFAYNSKTYYIITQGSGTGDNVIRVPITGNDTALDAIAQIGGLKSPESTEVWIARPAPNGVGREKILPIEWDQIAQNGSAINNYQLLPRDRVFISQKPTSAATN